MPTYNKENRSKIENILLGRHDAQISQDKTKTPVPRISDIFGTPKSNTYDEILASICDDVREKTGYDSYADCSDFMTPYEINTEPYNYDTSDSNYTLSTHEYKHVIELPVIQNLMYIYALNKFRKKKWENRVLDNKMRNKAELKKSIVKWLDKGKDQLLPLRDKLEKRRNQMDFMENEQTLGQHCFNNIPLIKQLYDEYLPWILNQ